MATSFRRDVVVIGGSAGGIEALARLAGGLPRDLAATVLAVIHTSPERPRLLDEVLSRAGPLDACFAKDGQRLRYGEILLAPPDEHMLVEGDRVRLTRGPRENGFRPAIDPLFRTAAESYGARVAGVILSGALDDGTSGLLEVKLAGGLALVQHADEAAFPSMPLSAMRSVEVDAVLPVHELATRIVRGAGRGLHDPDPKPYPKPERRATPPDRAEQGTKALADRSLPSPPSGLTCPECGGALWERAPGGIVQFHCHVGHSYGQSSLLAHQAEAVEGAMWTALRTLEEAAALRKRMAGHSIECGLDGLARLYVEAAAAAEHKAEQIRRVLTHPDPDASMAGAAREDPPPEDEGSR